MKVAPETEVINMQLQEVVQTGGGGSDEIWLPSVSEEGVISWTKSASSTAPTERNIKGADGQNGTDGTDGVGIASIEKTSTSGLIDTYTITLTNGNTATFNVTNGQNGQNGTDGLGIKSVAVNGSNHLIVTYDDDTPEDAGEIDVSVPIDDTTPASDKVYSSNKTNTLLSGKFDASYFTVSGGGVNLCDFTQSHYNWRPGLADGEKYTPGALQNNMFTTNLWTYSSNEKLKFYIATIPSYFRFIIYDAEFNFLMASGNYTTDTDGYYVIQMKKTAAAYMCFMMSGYQNNFETFNIGRYDTFGNLKVVVDDLFLSDDNVTMARNRLGLDTPDILHGKKWAVAGDSFSHGDGISDTIPSGTYQGQYAVYPYLIATRHNMTIQSFFENGRTLALPSGESASYNCFANHYQEVAADADYLTIYLGINDSHQSATIPIGTISDNTPASFYGAWNVILSWLIENRPNLKIGIIVSNGCDSDDYRTATIAIAQKYGIPYIDLNGDKQTPCMIRSTNASIASAVRTQRTLNWRVSSENLHPNAACHAFEATFIEDFLRTL